MRNMGSGFWRNSLKRNKISVVCHGKINVQMVYFRNVGVSGQITAYKKA